MVENVFFRKRTVQKIGISKIFKEVSYAHQCCIYLIKNTENLLILWNIAI